MMKAMRRMFNEEGGEREHGTPRPSAHLPVRDLPQLRQGGGPDLARQAHVEVRGEEGMNRCTCGFEAEDLAEHEKLHQPQVRTVESFTDASSLGYTNWWLVNAGGLEVLVYNNWVTENGVPKSSP